MPDATTTTTRQLVYVGTYTDPNPLRAAPASAAALVMGMAGPTGSVGIYVYEQDRASGELALRGTAAGVLNPSFLTLDPAGRFLFSVNEALERDGRPGGAVSSFAIEGDGTRLRFISMRESGGGNPCHLSTDRSGRFLLVANHEQGRVGVLPIGPDGALDPLASIHQHEATDPARHRQPHAHFVTPDPQGRFVLATDTGIDRVLVYRLDPQTGSLLLNDPPWGETHQGAGPRHLAFHPSGRYVYANGEADMTLTCFVYDGESGALTPRQHVTTLPEGVSGRFSTAQVVVEPRGRFAYVSNRGHDSIAIFAIDGATGLLTRLGNEPTRGRTPRNFQVDPAGRFLYAANQNSDTLVCFAVDGDTGALHATGHVVSVPAPTCVLFA